MGGVGLPDPEGLGRDGWVAIPGLLTPERADAVARRCAALLDDDGHDLRPGDKRAGGTRRAADLPARLPEVASLSEDPVLLGVVASLLGHPVPPADVAFRSPRPGFGRQSLHADDVAIDRAGECRAVTAVVALCDFTADNGATAVVPGSHRRPDLQRRVGRLDLAGAEVQLVGAAGTAFVFSAHLLHRGTLNRSERPRPALQAQWRLRGGGPAEH